MPMDKAGKYRPNHQLAAHADKMSAGRSAPPAAKLTPGAEPHEEGGDASELHDHGDGTYHSMIGGEKTEHPSLGHALMHMAAHHEPEGTHVHAHSDGMGVKTHHVSDGGEPQGPTEHESPEEAGQHMASVMNGEGGDSMPHGEPDGDEGMGMSGMRAMMNMR